MLNMVPPPPWPSPLLPPLAVALYRVLPTLNFASITMRPSAVMAPLTSPLRQSRRTVGLDHLQDALIGQWDVLVAAGFAARDPEALTGFAPFLLKQRIGGEGGPGEDGHWHGGGGLDLCDFDLQVRVEVLRLVKEQLAQQWLPDMLDAAAAHRSGPTRHQPSASQMKLKLRFPRPMVAVTSSFPGPKLTDGAQPMSFAGTGAGIF